MRVDHRFTGSTREEVQSMVQQSIKDAKTSGSDRPVVWDGSGGPVRCKPHPCTVLCLVVLCCVSSSQSHDEHGHVVFPNVF